jgi:lipoprotein-anchoring transpeptidase ErfK/SrfK
MLRAWAFALVLCAAFPSLSAIAAPDQSNTQVATAAESETPTSSGTTTYFGKDPASTTAPVTAPAATPAAVAAKPKPEPLPNPTLTAAVDLASQTMTVSVNGVSRYSWAISSGTAAFPTPTGTFRPEWTSKMWYSRKYDWAPMPNAVFINGGVAVHGTYHTAALGSPASHGCIRLSTANAKTFYNLVERHGLRFTRVSVFGRPHWRGGSEVASRASRKKTYAKQDNWFFGYSDTSDDPNSVYVQPKKKSRNKAYAYVYVDGVPVKVRKNKNGDYVMQKQPGRRANYKTYGSAAY